jgi:hypothetical protein
MSKQQSSFSLLNSFRATFDGQKYRHRNSVLGDIIASHLYEDLVTLGKSTLLVDRVTRKERVVNAANKTIGKKSRRGDGTFGELVPTTIAITEDGFRVARGEIANIEIGVETKILAKAMIKQIDRVIGDLIRQVEEFKRTGGHPICVGIVGFNQAPCYTSFEGDREHPTDGTKHKHPSQEAAPAEARVLAQAAPHFFELQVLRFRATNTPPFPFKLVDLAQTEREYSSLLVRLSREYDKRFSN